MTKSEVGIVVSYLVPLSIVYTGTLYDNPYIVIVGSLVVLLLVCITTIMFHKGEKIETNKTDNINNTSYTFYHK